MKRIRSQGTTKRAPVVSAFSADVPPKLLCPICGGELVRRHRGDLRDRPVAFWGCAGYRSSAKCRYTLSAEIFEAWKGRMIARWHDTIRLDEAEREGNGA